MAFQIVLLLVLLAFSGFFSGAETALFALSAHEINRFRRDKRASHRLVAQLLQNPRPLLLTLMIGNVTINMFIFAVSLALFQSISGQHAVLAPILGLASPIIVTLTGELLPKGTSFLTRNRVAPRIAPAVRFFQVLLRPISTTLNFLLVEPMTRLLTGSSRRAENVTPEELSTLVEMSQRRRIIDADENAMLSGIVQLHDLKVRDIMVPRIDVIAFELQDDPDALRRMMGERHFPKLPVYDGDMDHIAGLAYAKDLFLNPHSKIEDILRPIRFLPEVVTLTQALHHFQQTRSQLAIVVDEHGGVVGLVTLEDVAEEIVGELTDPEAEEQKPDWERLGPARFRVSGQLSIRDWAEQFHVGQLDPRVSTLGGYIVAHLGRIPDLGDQVCIGNLQLTVETLHKHRIEWVIAEIVSPSSASDGKEVAR